jgi:superfamily II DNA/RNA helicase
MMPANNTFDNSTDVEILAKQLRERLAEQGLPPTLAKLYSQHTRLRTNQPGLEGWRYEETWLRLHDAMRLTVSGLLEKELEVQGWQNSLRRAGEMLEWLSHSELNIDGLPLLSLASAVYQLAGYPARATGLLNQVDLSDDQSRILYYFLKADFRALLQEIVTYWSQPNILIDLNALPWDNEDELSSTIHRWITSETVSAMGILCAHMRWGNERRVNTANRKLSAIADLLLHAKDPYSWLIAKLCTEIASIYLDTSLRNNLIGLNNTVNQQGINAFEFYSRQSYLSSKALVWLSQLKGIRNLESGQSFVLCTPTGSGKTAIAEVAILQSLFANQVSEVDAEDLSEAETSVRSIALYLVPSRALATEVESKLSRVLRQVSREKVIVTGLYGGNDWGPTDAWLTADDKTVLICTYEKAEALMRFLGPLFLNHVSLIVIDEAHNILFDGDQSSLSKGENRGLRLESLCARLLALLEEHESRVIALSAVTAGAENLLSNWVTGSVNSSPVSTPYRSTRQLIGCLECSTSGYTEIRYDLLDNAPLQFQEQGRSSAPFIPNPFPVCPIPVKWLKEDGEKRTRPQLLWAAMHLTQSESGEQLRSVLISAPQQIGGYAEDFLKLLNDCWNDKSLPQFFRIPAEREKLELWQLSLASCEDYFTKESREYQLLEKGIVVHHGKMPGLLARLLIQLIDERIINLVLATSTLSEGVNLPFETVLIPSLLRSQETMSQSEFANLVGRAGRPGFGTEGRSLVVLPKLQDDRHNSKIKKSHQRYNQLMSEMRKNKTKAKSKSDVGIQSPLAELLLQLKIQWQHIAKSNSQDEFFAWLERTIPIEEQANRIKNQKEDSDVNLLDSLDTILLAAIVELENNTNENLSPDALEERLQQIWRKTYAYFASQNEEDLRRIFTRRGLVISQNIYPDKYIRKRLYCTSLPPISGHQLLLVYSSLIEHLKTGVDYYLWTVDQKFEFIIEIIRQLSTVPQYKIDEKLGNVEWQNVLRWWLNPQGTVEKPTKTQVSNWHRYVSKFFQYRINWGVGALIALAIDEAHKNQLKSPSLQDWPQTHLPWIIFWLKELIVWGTLDPVVAYLLARKLSFTRNEAMGTAKQYYQIYATSPSSEVLSAANIRKWADELSQRTRESSNEQWHYRINVELLRDFSKQKQRQWRVVPVVKDDNIEWVDMGGFPFARSSKPDNWQLTNLHTWDFFLDPLNQVVISQSYM